MKVSALIAGLKEGIAKSGGEAELYNGQTCVHNGYVPGQSECYAHLSLYACYVKWVLGSPAASGDLHDSIVRAAWGRNYIDFWYALRMPPHNLSRRQKWIRRLIRQSLLGRLTKAEGVVQL